MKRDMDLIRRIALEVETMPSGSTLDSLDGVDEDVFALHAIWMNEAGLIKAIIEEDLHDGCFVDISRLTWAGCEFASAAHDDTVWKKAKESVIKPGASFTFDLLKSWLKTEIGQGFPTLRGLGDQVV